MEFPEVVSQREGFVQDTGLKLSGNIRKLSEVWLHGTALSTNFALSLCPIITNCLGSIAGMGISPTFLSFLGGFYTGYGSQNANMYDNNWLVRMPFL